MEGCTREYCEPPFVGLRAQGAPHHLTFSVTPPIFCWTSPANSARSARVSIKFSSSAKRNEPMLPRRPQGSARRNQIRAFSVRRPRLLDASGAVPARQVQTSLRWSSTSLVVLHRPNCDTNSQVNLRRWRLRIVRACFVSSLRSRREIRPTELGILPSI